MIDETPFILEELGTGPSLLVGCAVGLVWVHPQFGRTIKGGERCRSVIGRGVDLLVLDDAQACGALGDQGAVILPPRALEGLAVEAVTASEKEHDAFRHA